MQKTVYDALNREDLIEARKLKQKEVWCYGEYGGNVNYGTYIHEYGSSFGVETPNRITGKMPKAYRYISLEKPVWIP